MIEIGSPVILDQGVRNLLGFYYEWKRSNCCFCGCNFSHLDPEVRCALPPKKVKRQGSAKLERSKFFIPV